MNKADIMVQPRIVSVQVGLPRKYGADAISSRVWQSGIFKHPVSGRVWLDTLNLAGDGQSDLENHGGPDRAVLAYAADHYPGWRAELDHPELPYGGFGENLTVTSLTEDTVCIGDVYTVGHARLQVTQPRLPCWKLARRWGINDLTARVDAKAAGGWYHRVLQEGYVEAGASYRLLDRPYPAFPVRMVFLLMKQRLENPDAVAALARMPALSEGWRQVFSERAAAL